MPTRRPSTDGSYSSLASHTKKLWQLSQNSHGKLTKKEVQKILGGLMAQGSFLVADCDENQWMLSVVWERKFVHHVIRYEPGSVRIIII